MEPQVQVVDNSAAQSSKAPYSRRSLLFLHTIPLLLFTAISVFFSIQFLATSGARLAILWLFLAAGSFSAVFSSLLEIGYLLLTGKEMPNPSHKLRYLSRLWQSLGSVLGFSLGVVVARLAGVAPEDAGALRLGLMSLLVLACVIGDAVVRIRIAGTQKAGVQNTALVYCNINAPSHEHSHARPGHWWTDTSTRDEIVSLKQK